jgi:hypothetical protein
MNLSAQRLDRTKQYVNLVKEAAVKNASTFLQLIPEGQEKEYGFENRTDFLNIKIEEPFQMYYMSYKENKLGFLNGNEWRVPLSVNGKYVALLTVVFNNEKAEVVDFGASVLAEKLQELEPQFIDGSQRILIRSTYLAHDYISPNFNTLSETEDATDFRAVNMDSTQLLYELNAGPAKAVTVNTLYVDTIAAINSMTEK